MELIESSTRPEDLSRNFTWEALARSSRPAIEATLQGTRKDRQRNSPLSPQLTTWLVVSL